MGCKCIEQNPNESNQFVEAKEIVLKGQYNNFRDYSNFLLKVVNKRFLNNDELEVEGFMMDKRGKSNFFGRISKKKVSIECRNLNDHNAELIEFEGNYEITRSKYLGEFKMKRNKKGFGSFWLEEFDENLWKNLERIEGSTSSTRFDRIRKTESYGQNSNINII